MQFVVINVERSQLGGVLKELKEVSPNMDIVINIQEEESKEEKPKEEKPEEKLDFHHLTTENLEQLEEGVMKEKKKEKSPT